MTSRKHPEDTNGIVPEFSRPVEIDKIGKHGTHEHIEADAEELAALAKRMGLPAIRSLQADFELMPWKKGRIRVRGTFRAEVDQECVRTLEIFSAVVSEPVDRIYMKSEYAAARGFATRDGAIVHTAEKGKEDFDPFSDDAPDIIVGDVIDIGELTAESLALALDPWPKKPGTERVVFSTEAQPSRDLEHEDAVNAESMEEKRSPFAALAALKDRLGNKD